MRKNILRISTILFILASLLPMNWSMDIDQAIAHSNAPSYFHQHYTYGDRILGATSRISWELDVDFPNGNIRAAWIFRIEQELQREQRYMPGVSAENENWLLTDEFIRYVQCDKHGQVTIQNGSAQFNAATRDYITCKTPDFGIIAKRMKDFFGLDPMLPDVGQSVGQNEHSTVICAKCIDPWMNAAIDIQGPQLNVYPIGYLESADEDPVQRLTDSPSKYPTVFQTEVVRTNNTLKLATNMTGWRTEEWSHPVALNGKHDLFTGMNVNRFIHTLKARNQSNNSNSTPWTQYWSSVQVLMMAEHAGIGDYDWLSWLENTKPFPISDKAQEHEMSTGSQLFYIGHNPETGAHFDGTMYNIGVDPGCVGI